MRLTFDALFDGWWVVESGGVRDEYFTYRQSVRQIFAGEERDIEYQKGPFPTREHAEKFLYRDCLEMYWEVGFTVYANHCLSCGDWAKVLAFDDAAGWSWRVTECRKCGIRDSRV